MQGEDSHLQALGTGVGQILLSQPSEETNIGDTLISDFQVPEP